MPTLADVLRQTGYAQDGTLATPTPTESPMTKVLAEHIKSLPQKFKENQAHQMSLLNQAFPGNTYESMMTQGDPKAMAELAMQTPFNAMIAYHGTPHNILGKFDISKVGTGEGAQAYGHGMYFAENPNVAKGYQESTTVKFKGSKATELPEQAWEEIGSVMQKHNIPGDMVAGVDEPKMVRMMLNKYAEKLAPQEKQIFEKYASPVEGNLYKVDIPDEYIPNMLDWDKPLREQPELLKTLGFDVKKYDKLKAQREAMPEKFDIDIPEELAQYEIARKLEKQMAEMPVDTLGKYFYEGLIKKYGNQKAISDALAEKGVKGIRYLDAGSRGKAAERSSNFVVFDPSEVKILEKNSKPVSRKELIEEQVNKLKD